MKRLVLVLSALLVAASAVAYPLDGDDATGIRRLWAYRLAQRGEIAGGPQLVVGAQLPLEAVRLRLTGYPHLDVARGAAKDPGLQAGLEAIFAARSPEYSVAVLDITDPAAPRFAGIREDQTRLPGSVGKLLVMTGLFNALARAQPLPADRLRVLRETMVTADRFAMPNSHTVPIVDVEARTLQHRSIRLGDRFSLFEWIDHMVSPSSNAAGAVSWKQAMLLTRFQRAYPPSADDEARFFSATPKADLTALAVGLLEEPLVAAGLEVGELRQGTMFTRGGEAVVPGTRSEASPRQLVRWMTRLEQGRLVDSWSSLEMKRLIYFTRRRYRYAVSPALTLAAVYFKSGSFYQCRPEPEFQCGQYRGNATNIMNSVALVENPARPEPGQTQRVYIVAMMSNVLRRNSAEDHRDIATDIDRLIARTHPTP